MIVVHVTSVNFTAENEKVDYEILLTSVLYFQYFLISEVIIHHFSISDTTKIYHTYILCEYNRVNVKNI